MRIGKWAENKIWFRDSDIGARGIQWSQGRKDSYYRLCFFGVGAIGADGASGLGGSCRITKSNWYQCNAAGLGGTGGGTQYMVEDGGHGIDNVVGALAVPLNEGTPTVVSPTVVDATTVRLNVEGYTAATVRVAVFIWGATSTLY